MKLQAHFKFCGIWLRTVLWGKCILLNAYIRKRERSQINDLSLHHEKLAKQEEIKPKVSRKKSKQ